MTPVDRAGETPGAENHPPLSPTGPLLLWLALQLVVLIVAAGRVPLAAKYPRPAESLALHLMLGAQVAVASLLFPLVLQNLRTAAMAIASTWPFQLLAAHLAAVPLTGLLPAAAYVTLWLVALSAWRTVFRTTRAQLSAAALATAATLGGAGLWYLRAEFAAPPPGDAAASEFYMNTFSPLVAAINELSPRESPDGPAWYAWAAVSAVLISGVVVAAISNRSARRDNTSAAVSTPPPPPRP